MLLVHRKRVIGWLPNKTWEWSVHCLTCKAYKYIRTTHESVGWVAIVVALQAHSDKTWVIVTSYRVRPINPLRWHVRMAVYFLSCRWCWFTPMRHGSDCFTFNREGHISPIKRHVRLAAYFLSYWCFWLVHPSEARDWSVHFLSCMSYQRHDVALGGIWWLHRNT